MKIIFIGLLLFTFDTSCCAGAIEDRVLHALDQTTPLQVNKIHKKAHVMGAIRNFELLEYTALTPDQREVKFSYYRHRDTRTKRPLILVIPAIGGFTPMETTLAAYFGSRNCNVVVAKISADISDLKREPEQMQEMVVQTNADTRGVLDFVASQSENDPHKIAAIGTSLGGIRLSMLLAVEKRIKAAALIVTGGDLPEIMATSEENTIVKYRKYKMRERGIQSVEEYQNLFARNIEVDPLITAPFLNRDHLMMFRSVIDKDVPTKNQYKLWNALGRPKSVEIRLPHIPTAGYTVLFKSGKIYRFFLQNFKNND